ncbi:Glycogen debranching enzyme [Streptomyces griseoloalbus]
MIGHLTSLGVTAVELMPVHQFVQDGVLQGRHLALNYWGYNTIGFFAPHNAYSAHGDPRPAGHWSSRRWSRRCTRRGSR